MTPITFAIVCGVEASHGSHSHSEGGDCTKAGATGGNHDSSLYSLWQSHFYNNIDKTLISLWNYKQLVITILSSGIQQAFQRKLLCLPHFLTALQHPVAWIPHGHVLVMLWAPPSLPLYLCCSALSPRRMKPMDWITWAPWPSGFKLGSSFEKHC